jgi:hypothetical protein
MDFFIVGEVTQFIAGGSGFMECYCFYGYELAGVHFLGPCKRFTVMLK